MDAKWPEIVAYVEERTACQVFRGSQNRNKNVIAIPSQYRITQGYWTSRLTRRQVLHVPYREVYIPVGIYTRYFTSAPSKAISDQLLKLIG